MTGTRRPRRAAAALALVVLAVAGCTDVGTEDDPVDRADLLASPEPLPTPTEPVPAPPTDGSPTPTASPTPSADPTASPTPTPSASASASATASPSPVTEDEAVAAAVARRGEREECGEGGIADDFHRVVAERDGVLLVFVTCFLGAYQANGELMAFDGELRSWPVEQWVDGVVAVTNEVVGDVATAPDGTIENLVRYRALGDCGLSQRWEVTDQRLVLVEAREQECEADAPPGGAAAWPVVHGG